MLKKRREHGRSDPARRQRPVRSFSLDVETLRVIDTWARNRGITASQAVDDLVARASR